MRIMMALKKDDFFGDEYKAKRDKKNNPKPDVQEVRITGISVPMGDLFVLMIGLAIAAVPAAIVVAVLYAFGGAFFFALVGQL